MWTSQPREKEQPRLLVEVGDWELVVLELTELSHGRSRCSRSGVAHAVEGRDCKDEAIMEKVKIVHVVTAVVAACIMVVVLIAASFLLLVLMAEVLLV